MPLAALPTELVESITEHLDLVSLRALRLTSSSINQQTLHHFRQRFLQHFTLRWDLPHFETLRSITEHSYFGGALQRLTVDATPYHAIRLWQLWKQIGDFNYVHSSTGCSIDEASASAGIYREYKKTKEDSDATTRFWNETQTDLNMLTSIFTHLDRLQTITFAYAGMDKGYGKFGRRYCETSQNEMSRPFVISMAAIAASGLTVESISISPTQEFGAVSIGRLETLSRYLPKFDHAFEHLGTLKINLRDWRHPEEGFEPPPGKIPFIVRFLAKCKSVRELELSCFSSLEGDTILHEMAQHCVFSHLQSCQLGLFRIFSIQDLFDFLAPSKATLERLSMSHIVLRDEGVTWGDVMRRLADEFELNWVTLQNLFTRNGTRVGLAGQKMGEVVLIGPGMKDALAVAADALVGGNWGPVWMLAPVAYPFIGMRI
ncbi:uncharacterized protein EI97DRAFT_469871 [Westerdykella ornata]|uniref:F-box domain-containing protein n=1 Tax=Westerdykella ornata TaxID=318751 RepID=A0A6A6JAX6_WESOR|nr:uncharacterized protein EI97DRAFT_469871 [Westerdykella ornata]KAF2273128.1 hypothetical protein EI97DRAFT_469871 [Westerdykella ornata]